MSTKRKNLELMDRTVKMIEQSLEFLQDEAPPFILVMFPEEKTGTRMICSIRGRATQVAKGIYKYLTMMCKELCKDEDI